MGTFPTADLVSRKVARADLRAAGTGNPGAANAAQVLGARAGAAVLVGDIAKGVAASVVGRSIAGAAGAHLAGSASVAGHCYPAWHGRRGGKGVAASVGQCLATFPAYFPIDVVVAAATASIPTWKQRAFTATAVSSVCWVVSGLVWWRRGLPNGWGPTPTVLLPVSAALSSAMIAQRFVASGSPAAPSTSSSTTPSTADDSAAPGAVIDAESAA